MVHVPEGLKARADLPLVDKSLIRSPPVRYRQAEKENKCAFSGQYK